MVQELALFEANLDDPEVMTVIESFRKQCEDNERGYPVKSTMFPSTFLTGRQVMRICGHHWFLSDVCWAFSSS